MPTCCSRSPPMTGVCQSTRQPRDGPRTRWHRQPHSSAALLAHRPRVTGRAPVGARSGGGEALRDWGFDPADVRLPWKEFHMLGRRIEIGMPNVRTVCSVEAEHHALP